MVETQYPPPQSAENLGFKLKFKSKPKPKPKGLRADNSEQDSKKLAEWRFGMKLLSQLPHVYVKLSMLGFAVPNWTRLRLLQEFDGQDQSLTLGLNCVPITRDPAKEALLKGLVTEVLNLFGTERCMFNSNWHLSGAISISDSETDEVTMPELFSRYVAWMEHLPPSEMDALFAGNAEEVHLTPQPTPIQAHA